mgnify:CR=1 FL=1
MVIPKKGKAYRGWKKMTWVIMAPTVDEYSQKAEIVDGNLYDHAKKAGKSVSGYILYTIHLAEEMIQEEELLQMARAAEKAYHSGKTKILKSLADLK